MTAESVLRDGVRALRGTIDQASREAAADRLARAVVWLLEVGMANEGELVDELMAALFGVDRGAIESALSFVAISPRHATALLGLALLGR